MTQDERVYKHLRDFGSITTLEAFDRYGITRLSGRIHTLRKSGIKIGAKYETTKNRYGEECRYAKYFLE